MFNPRDFMIINLKLSRHLEVNYNEPIRYIPPVKDSRFIATRRLFGSAFIKQEMSI